MRKIILIVCVLVSILGTLGCSTKEPDSGKMYSVYYLSNSETKIEIHEYEMQSETLEDLIQEMLLVLQTNPTNLKFKAPIAMGFEVLDSKTNFLFAAPGKLPAEEVFMKLRERKILVRYFKKPRIDRFLRITIGTDEQMQKMIAALEEILR